MSHRRADAFWAMGLSLLVHAMGLYLLAGGGGRLLPTPPAPEQVTWVALDLPPLEPVPAEAKSLPQPPAPAAPVRLAPTPAAETVGPPPVVQAAGDTPDRPVASMAAPPPPTAQEWAQAAAYTLKNSKRYRYTWAQQVRSMMGTAFEGADQGVVRFRVEIAPNGRLARVETLWSTSPTAEKLARQAIQNLPPLPPTPTGEPLVFEKTISFQPFADQGPPVYKNDCLPDPPAFVNPYAWDGRSPQGVARQPTAEKPSPEALAACLKGLEADSVEAESAHDKRQLEQWGAGSLGR